MKKTILKRLVSSHIYGPGWRLPDLKARPRGEVLKKNPMLRSNILKSFIETSKISKEHDANKHLCRNYARIEIVVAFVVVKVSTVIIVYSCLDITSQGVEVTSCKIDRIVLLCLLYLPIYNRCEAKFRTIDPSYSARHF